MSDEIYFFIGINLDLNLEFWVVVAGNGMARRKIWSAHVASQHLLTYKIISE